MSNRLRPVVGNWYNHLDKGDLFQVVALDEASGTIEIQEFDGGLDELDFEEWRQMSVEAAAPPEDWSGPVDDVEPDEFGYTDMQGEEPRAESLEAESLTWADVLEEEEAGDIELPPPTQSRPPPRAQNRRRH